LVSVSGLLRAAFCGVLAGSSCLAGVHTWQGGAPGDPTGWHEPANWSTGQAPARNDGHDVVIPGGLRHYPVLAQDAESDGNVTIEPGASLALAGHSLALVNLHGENRKGLLNRGTLDAGDSQPVLTVGRGGFANTGRVVGTPALALAGLCYDAVIAPGGAVLATLTLPAGSYSYRVGLAEDLTVTGDVVLNGHGLVVEKGATLTIRGRLRFAGPQARNAALALEGQAVLHGDLVSNNSAVCGGGGETSEGWLTLAGSGTQTIAADGDQAILPPLRLAAPGSVTLKGAVACAGLRIEKGATLDARQARSLTFGGAGSVSAHSRGLVNEGTLLGEPALVLSSGCYNAALAAGDGRFASLALDTGNYAYSVTLNGDLSVTGDVTLTTGSLNLGDCAVTVGGSWFFPPFPEKPATATVRLVAGKKAGIVFTSSTPAAIESGGVAAAHFHDAALPALTVDKPDGVLTVRRAPLEVKGTLRLLRGRIETADGGALWLGVVRDSRYGHYGIFDTALKLTGPLTPDLFPPIVPAPVPEMTSGVVRRVDNAIGPALPVSLDLVNIAPFARISTVPYLTMARLLVDPDEELRTLAVPEAGTPVSAPRYEFRYDRPQEIAAVAWAVPSGPWALLADTTGAGACNRLLRADLEGRIANPDGIWKSRAWIRNTFQPTLTGVYALQVVTFGTPHYYDVQILAPRRSARFRHQTARLGGPELTAGELVNVPAPPVDQQFLKGFHIEPWMFDALGWLSVDPAKRPPLTGYKAFVDFVQSVREYHGNVVNMWPPKTFGPPRGKGTYELDLLWPSRYDRWSIGENALEPIAQAFRQHGIKLFTMDRCVYPKALAEFPPTDTRDQPAPYVSRHSREFLKGFVLEQVRSGVDGVGVGYDEQMGGVLNPATADAFTKEVFRGRHKVAVPEKPDDTEAYRRWLVFGYEEFAAYLAEAAAAAKAANPQIATKTPTHVCLGSLWNRRIDLNVAEDLIGHTADIDFFRANCYEDYANLGHYITAANTARMVGANRGRAPDSLHNCPWANDPAKYPGYYLDTTPAYMYGPPVLAVMHGGRLPLYWRHNFIFYGGYDRYVEQAYSILDTLAAWGARDAVVPRQIAVLKSRASEDWWQVRQRYHPDGHPADQTRGFVYEKWLLEFLLAAGCPFRLYYLDCPEDFAAELSQYDLAILPFPYSVSRKAFAAVEAAADKGTRLLLFERQGETDEWGNAHGQPLFAALVASGRAVLVKDDVPAVGHHRSFLDRMKAEVDRLLGERRLIHFDSVGHDVELACLEKGPEEKFLCCVNWTDSPVQVEVGVRLPAAGRYECLQRDLNEVHRMRVGPRVALTAKDLRRFRLPLRPWELKVLYIRNSRAQTGQATRPGPAP
jgi:hypothetical protein